MREESYWQRTDTFAEKMAALEAAYRGGDYRLARAIADSLRHSLALEQQERGAHWRAGASRGGRSARGLAPRPLARVGARLGLRQDLRAR